MKNLLQGLLFCFILLPFTTQAQAEDAWSWASYSKKIPVNTYQGHRFRVQAWIKAEIKDFEDCAYLFARVHKEKGFNLFTTLQPVVKNTEWKQYTLIGLIGKNSDSLAFGPVANGSGNFYFDDVSLDIEIKKDEWKNIYTADFETGINPLVQGSQFNTRGINPYFLAQILRGYAATEAGRNCFKIARTTFADLADLNKDSLSPKTLINDTSEMTNFQENQDTTERMKWGSLSTQKPSYGFYGQEFRFPKQVEIASISVFIYDHPLHDETKATINFSVWSFKDKPTVELFISDTIRLKNDDINNWKTFQFEKPLQLKEGSYLFAVGQSKIQGFVAFGNGIAKEGYKTKLWCKAPFQTFSDGTKWIDLSKMLKSMGEPEEMLREVERSVFLMKLKYK